MIGERGSTRDSALLVGAAVSSGFVVVFLVSGVVIGAGLRVIVTWIPWLALVVGLGLVGAGIAELRGAHLFARLPGVKRSKRSRSLLGLAGFGASYGIASLSCTLPIFLSLVVSSVATRSLSETTLVFASYGAGMSLVVIVLTLALAAGRDKVLRAVRPLTARLSTISGWVMAAAGAFIVWYWVTVLSGGAAGLGSNSLVRFIENLTADVAGFVADRAGLAGAGVLVLGLALWAILRRSTDEELSNRERAGRRTRS
ncbi:MAG: cytochrome c biogenesis CcdA family protein [Actinomycetota bacterium]